MKQRHILSVLIIVAGLIFGYGCQPDPNSPESILKNVDAKQAMAIANEWKWSKEKIKSRVTSRDVVFELSENKVKRVPLPGNQMVVAIAPYIDQTHQ